MKSGKLICLAMLSLPIGAQPLPSLVAEALRNNRESLAAQKRYSSLYLMSPYPDGEGERDFRARWEAGGRRWCRTHSAIGRRAQRHASEHGSDPVLSPLRTRSARWQRRAEAPATDGGQLTLSLYHFRQSNP